MDIAELDYSLPKELIAQDPIPERDQSRLMVLNREKKNIEHHRFKDLLDYLQPGDVLVCNDTRVIPARLFGKKRETGGKVEVLLLSKYAEDGWYCLTKTRGHIKVGSQIVFEAGLEGTVTEVTADGRRVIQFSLTGQGFEQVLAQIGKIPLPPYIRHDLKDPERYQTVYSKYNGSVASPTAGLHFTDSLLAELISFGIQIEFITLHISLDTFKLIEEKNIYAHPVFREYCSVSVDTAQIVTETKLRGGRVIAAGTTVTRTLESALDKSSPTFFLRPYHGWTDIFITPGYNFGVIDCLITNFHLPRSTPLLLVGAFAGLNYVKQAYEIAVANQYRFFSFGDAMLVT